MSEQLAKKFHTLYEKYAPEFGYKTREESAVPWEQVPLKNRQLMTKVCSEIEKEFLTPKEKDFPQDKNGNYIELRDFEARIGTGVDIGCTGHKLWVCIDGAAVLRVKSPMIKLTDMRQEPVQLKEIPEYGDHMTLEEWVNAVNSGAFIDYDGDGHLATADKCSDIVIKPSSLKDDFVIPDWVTHIVWYNR